MRSLLCVLLFMPVMAGPGNPAPPPFYDAPARMPADIRSAFSRARELARLPGARLVIVERDDPRDCGAGAYSELAYKGMRPYDAVLICPNLRFVATDYEQIFFVIAHEFGHLKYRHSEAALGPDPERQAAGQEFEADRFAVDLTRQAGYDPAQGALTQWRVAGYLAAIGRADAPGHDRRERARRILERAGGVTN